MLVPLPLSVLLLLPVVVEVYKPSPGVRALPGRVLELVLLLVDDSIDAPLRALVVLVASPPPLVLDLLSDFLHCQYPKPTVSIGLPFADDGFSYC